MSSDEEVVCLRKDVKQTEEPVIKLQNNGMFYDFSEMCFLKTQQEQASRMTVLIQLFERQRLYTI